MPSTESPGESASVPYRCVLTIACPDKLGIVAAVSGFLTDHDAFITEAAQYGDPISKHFFMRVEFDAGSQMPERSEFERRFGAIAGRYQMFWRLYDARRRPRVVILVSKFDHCLNDLLYRYRTGELRIDIPGVISNHPDLRSLTEWHGLPFHHLPVGAESKAAQEAELSRMVREMDVDLVVLARYMQILSPNLSAQWEGMAINIHHSFLPSFKGAKPYHQAHQRGVKLIGATAHYVTSDLDGGPIIEQEVERVDHTHSPEELIAIGRDIENRVLSRAVRYHIEHRVLLNGRKTVVFS